MSRALEADFSEILLLPPSVEDWVAPESPARFIREFVAGLDAEEFALVRPSEKNEDGRPHYAPALLLRVWLYAYLRKVRSHRAVEAACRERVDFIWLSGNLQPDHNTLWRFWQSHRAVIKKLFVKTVRVANEMNLVGLVLQAVDGTKIQAACSGRKGWDKEGLSKALDRLEEQINALESAILQTGEQQRENEVGLPPELASARVLREKIQAALQKVEANETQYCHPQELEARRMECDGRNRFSYNAQAVTDDQEQIIVAADVVNEANDFGQLKPQIEQAEANLEERTAQSLADGGYCHGAQVEAMQAAGYQFLAPIRHDPKDPSDPTQEPYHSSRFRYDETTDTMVCPQGQTLSFRRERDREHAIVREYRSKGAVCRACPAFGVCTKDRHGRSVERWPWSAAMEAHRARMAQADAQETYRQRAPIIEPVFGWIKEAWQFRRWTVRGLEKVRAQWNMICAVSNLRVIYRAWLGAAALGKVGAGV